MACVKNQVASQIIMLDIKYLPMLCVAFFVHLLKASVCLIFFLNVFQGGFYLWRYSLVFYSIFYLIN